MEKHYFRFLSHKPKGLQREKQNTPDLENNNYTTTKISHTMPAPNTWNKNPDVSLELKCIIH